jgi:hypothetical protein
MRGKGLDTCARQLLKEIATVHSMDVILPLKDRGEVRLRVVAKPDHPVAKLLHRLGVSCCARRKCSGENHPLIDLSDCKSD